MSSRRKWISRARLCLQLLLQFTGAMVVLFGFVLAFPLLAPAGLIWAVFFQPSMSAKRRRRELLRINRLVEMHLIAHRIPDTRSNRELLFRMFGGRSERRVIR